MKPFSPSPFFVSLSSKRENWWFSIINWASGKVLSSLVSSIDRRSISALYNIYFILKILFLKEFMFRYPIIGFFIRFSSFYEHIYVLTIQKGLFRILTIIWLNYKSVYSGLLFVMHKLDCQFKFPELKNLLKIILLISFTKLPAEISISFFERCTPSSHHLKYS